MNKTKTSNLLRSIAFFLTAVVLTCTFGFTVDGWMIEKSDDNSLYGNNSPGFVAEDENQSAPESDSKNEEIPPKTPIYINPLTGEETDESTANATRFAFVLDPSTSLYGIEKADILVELPTEDEGSRFVAISQGCNNLWKIGSILPTRGYISNIAKYFGANLLAFGSDDETNYPACEIMDSYINLADNSSYCYTEQNKFVYTNCDLVNSAVSNNKTATDTQRSVPFVFNTEIKVSNKATIATLPISALYKSQLVYSSGSEKYSLIKNGETVKDHLNSKSIEFTNCFILFADSVTYDNFNCSQMIMETIGEGKGYYLTHGSFTEIKWSASRDGNINFYTTEGEILNINPGRSYISYIKSSKCNLVEFS